MGTPVKNRPQKPDAQVQPEGQCEVEQTDAVPNTSAKKWCLSTKTIFQRPHNHTLYELPGYSYFSKTAIPHAYNRVCGELQQAISTVEYFHSQQTCGRAQK